MSGYIYNTPQLFKQVVKQHSKSVAIKHVSGEECTYERLDSLSDAIAAYYIQIGVRKGDVIALFNNKSTYGFACVLASLKIGAIYTNLDTTSPYERVKKILDRCQPRLIIFDEDIELREYVSKDFDVDTVNLYDDFEAQLGENKNVEVAKLEGIVGSDPAYIMFTSGSTGFPKGAVITHSNLLNFIAWGQNEYSISNEDVFTNVNPIYFDNSVFDLYMSLFSGATLVPFTHEIAKDPFRLISEVEKAECNSWFSVPSLLVYLLTTKAISQGKLPAVKRFIFGGEGFPKAKLKKLYTLFNESATLYNVYGPTECTCICSSYVVSQQDFEDMSVLAPLGNLAGNFSYTLLDNSDNENFGELALIGPNVGAGYYNDSERTTKSFIQNPNCKYNEVIYRTGDLVEVDENGLLHFRGRTDNQVKHMGYRIELEEIESVLNTLSYIDEVAVVYEKLGEGLGQILCFVSVSQEKESTDVIEDLKKLVPDYMVPKKAYILDVLPKNQNGKIDRVALKEKKK